MNTTLFPTRQIGPFTISAISDGYIAGDVNFLSNMTPENALQIQHHAGITPPGNIHINCYLIQAQHHTILIDTGAGGIKQWGGKLVTNLQKMGITPTDIDTILLTHGHPDHLGGLNSADGTAIFPCAELYIHECEAAYWFDDDKRHQASERAQGNFAIARRALESYRDRLHLFKEGEIIHGIQTVQLFGHTEGHTGFLLNSDKESLLIWGDIVHFPYIQISHPDVAIAFDHDPVQAMNTRKKILDIAVKDKLLIAGMHFGEAAFARINYISGQYQIKYIN